MPRAQKRSSLGTALAGLAATLVIASASPAGASTDTTDAAPTETSPDSSATDSTSPSVSAPDSSDPSTSEEATSSLDEAALEQLAAFLADPDEAGLAEFFAVDSPAAVYAEGAVITTVNPVEALIPPPYETTVGENEITIGRGPEAVVLSGFVLDDDGLIVDLQRNSAWASDTIFAVDAEASIAEVTVEIHSVRWQAEGLMLVVAAVNDGAQPVTVEVDELTVDGDFSTSPVAFPGDVPAGETVAAIVPFPDADFSGSVVASVVVRGKPIPIEFDLPEAIVDPLGDDDEMQTPESFRDEAETYLGGPDVAEQTGVRYTDVECDVPESIDVGTEYECRALSDGHEWVFTVQITGEQELTVTEGHPTDGASTGGSDDSIADSADDTSADSTGTTDA